MTFVHVSSYALRSRLQKIEEEVLHGFPIFNCMAHATDLNEPAHIIASDILESLRHMERDFMHPLLDRCPVMEPYLDLRKSFPNRGTHHLAWKREFLTWDLNGLCYPVITTYLLHQPDKPDGTSILFLLFFFPSALPSPPTCERCYKGYCLHPTPIFFAISFPQAGLTPHNCHSLL